MNVRTLVLVRRIGSTAAVAGARLVVIEAARYQLVTRVVIGVERNRIVTLTKPPGRPAGARTIGLPHLTFPPGVMDAETR